MILQRIVVVGGLMKKVISIVLCVLTMTMVGCSATKTNTDKLKDLEYTIVREQEIPSEIQALIEENKSTHMKLSYTDQGKTYIIIGYGAQKTSGYSVEILEVYESSNVVVVDTNLLGPTPEEEIVEAATFPYVVLLIEENNKPIVFD